MNDFEFDSERYVKSIENTLNEAYIKNGYVELIDLWVATSLPEDLILEILKKYELDNVDPEIKGVKYKNKIYNIKRRN
jgi:hypothetical protein